MTAANGFLEPASSSIVSVTAMNVLADLQALRREPVGGCVVGATYAVWCGATDLVGLIQWGAPDARDVRELVELLDFIRAPAMAPACRVLLDISAIERVDPDVLVGFVALLREWLPRWAPHIARQAVIVPDGLAGILLAGPLSLLAPSYPFRFVSTTADALAFVDHPAARTAYDEAHAIAAAARGTASLVARLRSALAADLVRATIRRSAAALAVSGRTLQRELARAGTSFSDELRRARVAAAVELLRLDTGKLDAIAARVGFGRSARMNAALRRELGVTASELRARGRR